MVEYGTINNDSKSVKKSALRNRNIWSTVGAIALLTTGTWLCNSEKQNSEYESDIGKLRADTTQLKNKAREDAIYISSLESENDSFGSYTDSLTGANYDMRNSLASKDAQFGRERSRLLNRLKKYGGDVKATPEYKALEKRLQTALKSGGVKKGSPEYVAMENQLKGMEKKYGDLNKAHQELLKSKGMPGDSSLQLAYAKINDLEKELKNIREGGDTELIPKDSYNQMRDLYHKEIAKNKALKQQASQSRKYAHKKNGNGGSFEVEKKKEFLDIFDPKRPKLVDVKDRIMTFKDNDPENMVAYAEVGGKNVQLKRASGNDDQVDFYYPKGIPKTGKAVIYVNAVDKDNNIGPIYSVYFVDGKVSKKRPSVNMKKSKESLSK